MIRRFAIWGTTTVFAVGAALAEAPASSPRPQARIQPASAPGPLPADPDQSKITLAGVPVRIGAEIRPMPRGGVFTAASVPADSAVAVTRQVTRVHFDALYRPSPRPSHPLDGYTVTLASARPAATPGAPHPQPRPAGFGKLFKKRDGGYSKKGSVCGVNAIKGVEKAPVGKPSSGCGIAHPVQVTSVSGVKLSRPATIDCTTAKALNTWVSEGVKPAVGRRGGGVVELDVFAHYACRTRNNRPGGKLSEHAKGHAVDVGGFRLADGTEVTVLHGWRSKRDAKMMKKIHGAACGPFGTVLGPNADGYHQDHFHVDTARYRSGSYCK